MAVRDACPGCGSNPSKKNGQIHHGKQNHQCKACGRPVVWLAENRVMAEEQGRLVARWLRENISRHGMCCAVGVGIKWRMPLMVDRFTAAPEPLSVHLPDSPAAVMMRRLEADEMCSVVGKKANTQWIWIAMDTHVHSYLTRCGVDPVMVTGNSTSGCVRATVIDAVSAGFRVIGPRPCVADRVLLSHLVNLFDIDATYGEVMDGDEVITALERLAGG